MFGFISNLPADTPFLAARKQLFLIVFTGCVLLWFISSFLMIFVGFSGDEFFHNSRGSMIANFNFGGNFLGNGWFMPGPAIATFLVDFFWPDPNIPGLNSAGKRLLISVVSFFLFIKLIKLAGSVLGYKYALTIMFFLPIMPAWLFFKSSLWGDLIGGLLLGIIFFKTYSISIKILNNEDKEQKFWINFLQLGLWVGIAIYFRGNLLSLSPTLLVYFQY